MQVVNFDLWGVLLGFFFFLTTCNSSVPAEVNNSKLTAPNNTEEKRVDYSNVTNKLTLILLGDNIYAFEGSEITKGKMVGKENIRTTIQVAKRKYPSDNFIVIIKPTVKATYQNTVDLLDEMTINKIERYSLEKLSQEEKQLLKTDNQSNFNRLEKH
jgi:hypothetical protein